MPLSPEMNSFTRPEPPAPTSVQTKLRIHQVVFNAVSELVSVLGEDQVYRMVNNAWCRAMGRERDAAVGRHVNDVFTDGLDEARQKAVAQCLRDNLVITVRAPINVQGLHGRAFETTYSPFGLDDAGVRCVVVVTRDVTQTEVAQRALAASVENLSRTLNATVDGIFAVDSHDPDTPMRFVNERLLQMWGINPALGPSLTPRQFTENCRPCFDDPEAHLARVQQIVDSKISADDVLELRDGRTLLRRCVSASDANPDNVALRVWSFRDVTAETRALQRAVGAESQIRQMLEVFPGHIAVLDEHLAYRYANPAFADLLQIPLQGLLGKTVFELFGPERGLEIKVIAEQAQQGHSVVYDRQVRDRTVQITLACRVDELTNAPRYYGFGIDVTGRKRAEEASLAARDEAERANLAKSQFLSHMSHELRTPLNAVLGFAQLLEANEQEPLAATQRAHVGEILRGARHLLRLINDVLDLGLVETGHLSVETTQVSLGHLVQACLHMVEPLAQARGIHLQALPARSFERLVLADATRLKQVLLNLLANAIKYNQSGGEVVMQCVLRRDKIRLFVHDNGPGLTPEQQGRLFTPFERMGVSSTQVEGAGIGLALSKRLMLAMSGDIGMQTREGGGSSFWIDVRRLAGREVTPGTADDIETAALTVATNAAPQRVLYIEDNDVNTVLMQAMLERLPNVVLHCEAHPHAGLTWARQHLPDLILLDIQLPDMDGYAVLQALKSDPATQHIPVIAVTANAMATDLSHAQNAGFFSYVTKPLELRVLMTAVQAALDHITGLRNSA